MTFEEAVSKKTAIGITYYKAVKEDKEYVFDVFVAPLNALAFTHFKAYYKSKFPYIIDRDAIRFETSEGFDVFGISWDEKENIFIFERMETD